MENDFIWELIELPQTEVPQTSRKILRNSIIEHMLPAYPGMFEHGNSTLQSKIMGLIPTQGITCEKLHRILNLDHTMIYTYLTTLIRRREVISIRINGRTTRYYKAEDIPKILMLPYRPQRLFIFTQV